MLFAKAQPWRNEAVQQVQSMHGQLGGIQGGWVCGLKSVGICDAFWDIMAWAGSGALTGPQGRAFTAAAYGARPARARGR